MIAELAVAMFLQDRDSMVGIVVSDREGNLTTFVATILGASKRITTRVGIGWIKGPEGWQWVKTDQGEVISGDTSEVKARLLPTSQPIYRGPDGAVWRISWLEPGRVSWRLAALEPNAYVYDVTTSELGFNLGPEVDREKVSIGQDDALDKFSQADQEKWSPLNPYPGTGGWIFRDGRLCWGMRYQSAKAGPKEFLTLFSPVDTRPQTLWSTAKGIAPDAIAGIGSEKSGWGFIVTPEEVRLAGVSKGRFGAVQRVQAWASTSVVAWWEASNDIQTLDDEFRALHVPDH